MNHASLSALDAVVAGTERWAVITYDCIALMESLDNVRIDTCITDPPYSKHVHESVRSSKRAELPDTEDFECRTRRMVDLGFEYLDAPTRRAAAKHIARLTKRWTVVFSDIESDWLWRMSLRAAGAEYIRTMVWERIGGAPQFTGDRPATGVEAMTIAHALKDNGKPMKKSWNGGGKAGVYSFPIVANRKGEQGSRVHPTQKPLDLLLALVDDFTEPDEVVFDPFCGSGTTGVAALRRGRRFIGIERKPEHADVARERLAAEEKQLDLVDARRGQESLFGRTA